jgi:hypothetical protein
MLASFNRVFDYSDFDSKLRHYFTDTAPIYAHVETLLKEVRISAGGKLAVQVILDDTAGVKENIAGIIKRCEQSLYPKMLDVSEQTISLSDEQKKELLLQGFSLDQIYEKQMKRVWKRFTIIRFNSSKNSIDYKEEAEGALFRARFSRPLIMFRDNLLRLAEGGQEGMKELYQFVLSNARIENLEEAAPNG